MKRILFQTSLSVGVLIALSACSSTSSDTAMSEYPINDDMIPPWVTGDDSGIQVDAGPTWSSVSDRNNYPIPEPGESLPDSGASATASQSQEVIVTDRPYTDGTSVITPPPPTEPRVRPTKKTPEITKPTLLVYKVRKGDNLSVIAERCGTTVSAIRRASGIKGDLIYAGSTIKVPYTPKAQRHINSSGRSGSSSSSGGTVSGGSSYTIKSGDTISSIAKRHGLGYLTLMKANNMTEAQARRLQPGQKITIPKK